MVIAILAIAHLVIPLLLILWILKTKAKSKLFLGSLIVLFPLYTYVVGFSVIGFWPIFSVYLPVLLLAAYLLAVALKVRRVSQLCWLPAGNWREIVPLSVNILLIVIFALPLTNIYQARNFEGSAMELSYPLNEGNYFVITGGSNSMVNQHAVSNPQRYALDIVQLNAVGSRAAGLSPVDLASYRIFGAEVVSPCSGEVLWALDGLPNRPISDFDADNPAGNHILIGCNGNTVVLAHLDSGSLAVAQGDQVAAGQFIARVGNSGATIEPHLHIHAVQGHHTSESALESATGIPIKFDGRYLIKNDRISL